MNKLNPLSTVGVTALLGAVGLMTSCNEKSEAEYYFSPLNLAVTDFTLNTKNGSQEIDTTFFTIDLQRMMIFNADSLRKGTDVSKLVAKIRFSSGLSEAKIVMTGGSVREGEINYQENPTDSIDFTGDVKLIIKTGGTMEATYDIKVNVHKLDPEVLYWDDTALNALPTQAAAPLRQRTVQIGETAYCLIEESAGTYVLRKSDNIEGWQWNDLNTTFGFTPDVESFTASDDKLWILDTAGHLYSMDPTQGSWTSTSEIWSSIIGGYTDTVIGLKSNGSETIYSQYPASGINSTKIPDEFPVSGRSNFVTLTNLWTSSPVAFFCGGRTAAGDISSATWAFDGTEWIQLGRNGQDGIPALEGASLIQYYNYRKSASGNTMNEFKVWMLMGGRKSDGEFNRTVYVSYDNGVNWSTGSDAMQLPEVIPAMANCDQVVIDTQKSANLSDLWKKKANSRRRIKYELDGDIIKWECPYIYMFGGYAPDGTLYNTVWRGVLNRLTFTPII